MISIKKKKKIVKTLSIYKYHTKLRNDYPTTITFPEIENCEAIQKFHIYPR